MRYIYLPLDDRPCTMQFPRQLAVAAGEEITVPHDISQKDFREPYPFEKSREFLFAHAGNDVCLMLAVDQLCFGGLLQSRKMGDVGEAEALRRLETVRKLKARYPGMQIHAFSVIMRASISTLSKADLQHYSNMTLFCQLSHKVHLWHREADEKALAAVRAQIPEVLLSHYLSVRARNHAVNMASLHLAREGTLDTLMLLQEDAQEYGLHRLEQQKLEAAKAGDGRIFIHNGADEGGTMASLCAIARNRGLKGRLAVRYLRGDEGEFVARYEDRPFKENLESHLRYAGLERVSEDASDHVLCILSPDERGQRDMADDIDETDAPPMQAAFAAQMAALHEKGKKVYFLDLTLANGGLPGMLEKIHEAMGIRQLWGYSAWNTTCNSLGTVVGQILSDMMAGKRNEIFLWERMLDDCVYEGILRKKLRDIVTLRGEDGLALTDKKRAENDLAALAKEEMQRHAFTRDMPLQYAYGLPWPRVFECRVSCAAK